MWGITVIDKHYDNSGSIVGVLVSVDNGDTQYMTMSEYDKFIKKRQENGYQEPNKD